MRDVGYEVLAHAFELAQPGHVVENHHDSGLLVSPSNRGHAHVQVALDPSGQGGLQMDLFTALQSLVYGLLDDAVARHLHGPAALQGEFGAEQPAERPVGQRDSAVEADHQDTFGDTVQDRLQAGLLRRDLRDPLPRLQAEVAQGSFQFGQF